MRYHNITRPTRSADARGLSLWEELLSLRTEVDDLAKHGKIGKEKAEELSNTVLLLIKHSPDYAELSLGPKDPAQHDTVIQKGVERLNAVTKASNALYTQRVRTESQTHH